MFEYNHNQLQYHLNDLTSAVVFPVLMLERLLTSASGVSNVNDYPH